MMNPIERLPLFYPLQRAGRPVLSFPARILMYVIIDLLLMNVIVFSLVLLESLSVALSVWAIEVLAIGAGMVLWVHRHRLKW